MIRSVWRSGSVFFDLFEFFEAGQLAVLLGQPEQLQLIAPLGNGKIHGREQFRIGHHRHDHFAGQRNTLFPCLGKYLPQSESEQFVGRLVQSSPHLEGERMHHGSVHDPHVVAERRPLVVQDIDDLQVGQRSADDDRPAAVTGEHLQLVFDAGGLFEMESFGQSFHFGRKILFGGPQVAAQYVFGPGDAPGVILFALVSHARPSAVADMVFEADGIGTAGDGLRAEVQFAGTQGVQPADQLQHGALHGHGRIGAEISGAVPDEFAGGKDSRKGFVLDDDPRIAFAVLEQDIVSGLKLFDEVVFEQQSVGFAPYDDMPQVGDLTHHDLHFTGMVGSRYEIGAYAALEVLGFAHVYDDPFGVEELVHAGAVGQQGYFFSDALTYVFVAVHLFSLQ